MTQCNINRLAGLYEILLAHPGEFTGTGLADKAGLNRSYIYRHALHQMEEQGFLLNQDNRGHLFAFVAIEGATEILAARENGACFTHAIIKTRTARIEQR